MVDVVVTDVRRSILDRSLPPGAPVSIADLSARLGVSHIPVREALRRLASEGLIELRRSRTAIVAPLSVEDLHDVFRLRILIESDAVANAIKTYDDDDLNAIDEAWERLEIAPDDDAESVAERHVEFHRRLLKPSPWDRRLLDTLWQAGDRYMYLILNEVMALGPRDFREQHRPLLDAAHARSVRAARKATAEHLQGGMGLIGPALPTLAPQT